MKYKGLLKIFLLLLFPLVFAIVTILVRFDIVHLLNICLGFIFVIIGIAMPKLKTNRWIGIRIKWTMEDPDIWNQVHRIAGPLWIIGGYVVALEAFFLPRRWIGPVMLGIIFFLSAFSIIHAWLLARKKQESK